MSSLPRRSARLSPHLLEQTQRSNSQPSIPHFQYSQPSSTSTTSHPSPTNDALHPPPPPPTPQQANPFGSLRVQSSNMPQPTHLNAPLPSPSASDVNPFSALRPHSQPAFATAQQAQEQSMFGQQRQNQDQAQLHPHTNSFNHGQGGARPHMGMDPGQLPPDFLAEAAKRAQIACLMRDMGDVSL
jgi:hypothetical protein